MIIVGCGFHPGWQQVAVFDAETGEIGEVRLENGNGEAERCYRQLSSPARIGFEACGNTQWFEDLLDRLGHEVWIGDAAEIRASYVRKQKTDRRDAAADGEPLSAVVAAQCCSARSAPVADSSSQAGRHSDEGEGRAATADVEQGPADEAEAVERSWSAGVTSTAAGRMGGSTQTRPAQPAQRSPPADSSARRGYRTCCPEEPASAVADDAAWRGSEHRIGIRADYGGGESLQTRQAGGELSWPIPSEHSSSQRRRLGSISKPGNCSCACCSSRARKR
jgi:hypothetical protein